jgi:hypothetical protein
VVRSPLLDVPPKNQPSIPNLIFGGDAFRSGALAWPMAAIIRNYTIPPPGKVQAADPNPQETGPSASSFSPKPRGPSQRFW